MLVSTGNAMAKSPAFGEPKLSLASLVGRFGGRFSAEMGIELGSAESGEIFKWFLAAVLFGARISETIALRTYREFEKERLLGPQSIVKRGWDGLVAVLDSGGYVRYDFKTATKLLEVSRSLLESYAGDLNALHGASADSQDLEKRIKRLGSGIGEVTTNIFLRELRGVWRKADPPASELVILAGRKLEILPHHLKDKRRAITMLKEKWAGEGNQPADFPDFEAALLRYGLTLRRKMRRRLAKRRVSRCNTSA